MVGEGEYGFEGELALAIGEEIFETGAEKVHDHHVVFALHSVPQHVRNPRYSFTRPYLLPEAACKVVPRKRAAGVWLWPVPKFMERVQV